MSKSKEPAPVHQTPDNTTDAPDHRHGQWEPDKQTNRIVRAEPSTMSIVQQFAADPNFDVEKLRALLLMKKEQDADEARKAFFRDLALCQEAMPAVVRDATNSQTSSNYATLDVVNRITRPILAKHGFSVSFAEADCPVEKWKRTIADLRHKDGHAVQYHIDLPLDGFGAKGNAIGAMNPVQAAISTGTYGQRVLLCRILNLAIADSDQDGQNTSATINQEQIDMLAKLIKDTGTEEKRFLTWAKTESLEAMLQSEFPKARDMLQRKAAQKPAAPPSAAPLTGPITKEQREAIEIEVGVYGGSLNGKYPDGSPIMPEGKKKLTDLTAAEAEVVLKGLKALNQTSVA